MTQSKSLPWYQDGLRFKCTECGQCCTGAPGAVWISDEEISNLCQLLNLDKETLETKYLRRISGRWALQERNPNYDCVFLDGKKCTVYQARPLQCRTFPFWPGSVQSPEAWKHAATYCEGINEEAPIVPFEEIQKTLSLHQDT